METTRGMSWVNSTLCLVTNVVKAFQPWQPSSSIWGCTESRRSSTAGQQAADWLLPVRNSFSSTSLLNMAFRAKRRGADMSKRNVNFVSWASTNTTLRSTCCVTMGKRTSHALNVEKSWNDRKALNCTWCYTQESRTTSVTNADTTSTQYSPCRITGTTSITATI